MTAALALSVVALLATIAVLVLLLTKQRAAKQKISDELRETSARLERYSGIQSVEGEVQRLTTDADHLRNLRYPTLGCSRLIPRSIHLPVSAVL